MSNLKKIKVNNFILNNIILGIFILILAYNLENILNIFTPKIIEGNTDNTNITAAILKIHRNQARKIANLNHVVTKLQKENNNIRDQITEQAKRKLNSLKKII
tara:strand:- start:224 stop:532 length:309 start_codon:yes stop_codon:yes gene_type:complete